MSKYYILAIGGSGALSVESLVHLCAAGIIGDHEINVMVVDPDQTNENIQRLQQTLINYGKIRNVITQKKSEFFTAKFNYKGLWNPNKNDALNLERGISYVQFNKDDIIQYRILTNLLFSEEKRKEKLDKGYKGNPMLGTIFMKDIELDETFREIAAEQELNLFVFGSLFGGTGAAGLPVMGKSLREMRIRSGKQTYIGSCILLPYFNIKQPKESSLNDFESRDINLLPDSGNFLPAVKFAVPFYLDKAKNKENGYDSIYFLGCPDSFVLSQREFAIGGREQSNKSHYINLFSASSFSHFINEENKKEIHKSKDTRFLATAIDIKDNYLSFNNIPSVFNEDSQNRLESMYVSSIYYLKYFLTVGKDTPAALTWFHHDKKGLNYKPDFFNRKFVEDLKIYFENYLIWIAQMKTNKLGLELFNTIYYDEESDTIDISKYRDELITGYRLHKENPRKRLFASYKELKDITKCYDDVVGNIEKTDEYQKFLDTLYFGSRRFIKSHYLKN